MTKNDYDPIKLEIFKHMFAAIPEEMGAVLQKSSYSPNIKERRDFSCALFDAEGNMIAQAAHIPVHLGAMPLTVHLGLLPTAPITPTWAGCHPDRCRLPGNCTRKVSSFPPSSWLKVGISTAGFGR